MFTPTQTEPPPDAAQSPIGVLGLKPEPVSAANQIILPEGETVRSVAWWLVLIAFIALAARVLLFVLGPGIDMERAAYPDSPRYIDLGHNLIAHGAFGLEGETGGAVHVPLAELRAEQGELEPAFENGLQPEVFRTPGYPAVIAAIEFMRLPMHGLLLLQCVVSVLSVLLVFGVANAVLDAPRPALLAALIVALHPADIMAPNAILSETMFVGLLMMGIWLIASKKSRNVWHCSVGGFAIGLAILVRPIAVFLGPALALWMIVTDFRLRTIGSAVVLTVVSLLPPVLWMVRNNEAGFGYRLSSVPYINGFFYTANYMNITEADGDWAEDWPAGVEAQLEQLKAEQLAGEDVFDTMGRLTVDQVAAEPGLYATVMRHSAFKFFTDHSMSGLYQQLGLTYEPTGWRDRILTGDWSMAGTQHTVTALLSLAWFGVNALLLVGTILGLTLLLWRRQWGAVLLLGGLLVYFVFATQAAGLERFRLPVLGIQAVVIATMFAPAPIRVPRPKKNKKFKRRMAESFDKEPEPAAVRPLATGRPI